MLQIFLIPRQRAKIGLVVFCAFALMSLFTACQREAQVEQNPPQSPQPEQSPPPEQSPQAEQSPQSRQSPQPQQSPEPQLSPEPEQSPQPQPSAEPQHPQELHARTVTDVHAVISMLEDYKDRSGAYPTKQQLESLGAVRKDPWGNDYIYQSPSTRGRESYDFFSPGPDHVPDTPDDDWGEE